MARLLLIHDDPSLLDAMRRSFQSAGYDVDTADCGEWPLDRRRLSLADLIVLDASAGVDAAESLPRIRSASDLPVILVGTRDEEAEVLRGFRLGADDVVVGRCRLPELVARVGAVLARSSRSGGCSTMLSRGGFVVDQAKHRVRRRGGWIKLTPTEFRLLMLLMEEPGRVISAEELVTRVWGEEYAEQADYVRRYIWYLRHKLEDRPEQPAFLRNERNAGYFFSESSAAETRRVRAPAPIRPRSSQLMVRRKRPGVS